MKKLLNRLNVIYRWIRSYISPVFIVLFCASFILWYIIKLGNVYTTNYDLRLNIDGESLRVPCVVEGVGFVVQPAGKLCPMVGSITISLSGLLRLLNGAKLV